MRLARALLHLTKATAAVALCLGSSAAVAAGAVRPSVKPVVAPSADSVMAALPVRAGNPTDDSENSLLGGALIPLLTLVVVALTVATVVVGGDEDEPISPS